MRVRGTANGESREEEEEEEERSEVVGTSWIIPDSINFLFFLRSLYDPFLWRLCNYPCIADGMI